MEADHLGVRLLHDLAHGCIEGGAVTGRNGSRRIDCELLIVGAKPLAPRGFACIIEDRGRVAEKIEVNGIARPRSDLRHLLANLRSIEHCARQRSERSGRGGLGCQLPVHGARHGCLDDRQLDFEKIDQATVGPHIRALLVAMNWRAIHINI